MRLTMSLKGEIKMKNIYLKLEMVIILFAVLFSTNISFSQYAKVPDNNLKKALNVKLGNGDVTTDITIRELHRMTGSFEAENKSISDITGLEHCMSLTGIKLGNNSIQDLIPLSNLVFLVELQIEGNLIKDLTPLSGLTHLRVLNISFNPVTDFSPVVNMDQCKILGIPE